MITSDSDIAAINALLRQRGMRGYPYGYLRRSLWLRRHLGKHGKPQNLLLKERYKKREANPELSPLRQHFQRNKHTLYRFGGGNGSTHSACSVIISCVRC